MKRRYALAAASLVVLAGCRALVGIDVYEIAGDGGANANDGSVEDSTTSADAGGSPHDAGPGADTNPPGPPDTGPNTDDSGCGGVNPCPPCCHQAYPDLFRLSAQVALDGGCLCANKTGDCTSECAADCANNFANPMPQASCNGCLDQLLTSSQCGAILQTKCGATCRPPLDCLTKTCGLP